MAELVVGADGNDSDPRVHGSEERGVGCLRTVVWHLQDVRADIRAVEAVRSDYERMMERVARLYEGMQSDLPRESQYVIPFGYRVRYNVQLNLREAYHWLEFRSTPQGHPDYRRTSQAMYHAIRAVHPELVEPMGYIDLTPDIPIGRLRAEMRRASK